MYHLETDEKMGCSFPGIRYTPKRDVGHGHHRSLSDQSPTVSSINRDSRMNIGLLQNISRNVMCPFE